MIWFTHNVLKNRILDWEKKLYAPGKVADKYDILERIRLELDRLYKEDRQKYDELEKALRPNTWEALEDVEESQTPSTSKIISVDIDSGFLLLAI